MATPCPRVARSTRPRIVDTRPAVPKSDAARSHTLDVPRLCTRLRAGDADAFETIYRVWYAPVLMIATRFTGRDEAFALDLTHDVMLRAATRLPVLADERALGAWFTRTTVRLAVDAMRRDARRTRRHAAAARPDVHSDPTRPDWREAAALAAALDTLDPMDVDLLLTRLGQGLTLREAALAAGLSTQAAHGRVRRALDHLRSIAGRLL